MAISKKTMELLKIARCADVCDALDSMGHQDTYEMSVTMRPLFPGIRFCGIAHTQEWEPWERKMAAMTYETFDKIQYAAIEDGGYNAYWRPGVDIYNGAEGDVFVIAAKGIRGGILGSANTLDFAAKGVVGFVIDGTMRDSNEAIMQKSPVFSTVRSYTHPNGRLRIKSDNEPCVCAGVLVHPGDIVMGDDDGVIVIPQSLAGEVAVRAYKIQQKDRKDRRGFYERLNRPYDETVELLPDID
jgi:regulator of RNase E activity RraA